MMTQTHAKVVTLQVVKLTVFAILIPAYASVVWAIQTASDGYHSVIQLHNNALNVWIHVNSACVIPTSNHALAV
jgi:hypothetical protein